MENMNKHQMIERRKLEVFNVMTSLYLLYGHRTMITTSATANMIMYNLDALCGFTPAQSVQARDMIFDGSETGVIPEWTIKSIGTCCIKLADFVAQYQGLESQDNEMWMALYNLLEVECLFEAANPEKPDSGAIEDGKADGYGVRGNDYE